MKFLIQSEKVRPTYNLYSGIGLCISFLSRISKSYFVPIIYKVIKLFHSCVGDNLKWYPSKKGGHANNLLSFRANCESHIFGNDLARFINKGVRDLERFFASKWPDLRTKYFQEGGYNVISVASCHDTIRWHQNWPKHEGPKCKIKCWTI